LANTVCHVVWTPEGCAGENELEAPPAEQRSLRVASEDDFALTILVIIRFTHTPLYTYCYDDVVFFYKCFYCYVNLHTLHH